MKASVVILVWNGMAYLADCLDAVLSQRYPDFEVIVVDNASTDGSADFIAKTYPRVHVIRNERNLGFAGGCNVGLRETTGDLLVLLNQDTVVNSGWLETLVAALKSEKVGVAGCKILYPDGETIQHAGGWIEWPLGLAQHYGQSEQDIGQWDTARPVDYVTGAAMALRRDVLEEVGLLDEAFWPGYFEDVDLCHRVREAGYDVWYTPDATLTHVEGTSYANQVQRWESYHRGRLRFVLKHTPPDQFLATFVQSEALFQPSVVKPFGSRPLGRAYLETISRTGSLLDHYWGAQAATIKEVVQAFRRLHSLAWRRDWERAEEKVTASVAVPPPPTSLDYEKLVEARPAPQLGLESGGLGLQELEFRSDKPVVGPLISWLRSSWYEVAAKWGIRHLMQQQEAVNRTYAEWHRRQEAINRHYADWLDAINKHHVRRQEALRERYQHYIEALEDRLSELADENALLAGEIANLSLTARDLPTGQPPSMDENHE